MFAGAKDKGYRCSLLGESVTNPTVFPSFVLTAHVSVKRRDYFGERRVEGTCTCGEREKERERRLLLIFQ